MVKAFSTWQPVDQYSACVFSIILSASLDKGVRNTDWNCLTINLNLSLTSMARKICDSCIITYIFMDFLLDLFSFAHLVPDISEENKSVLSPFALV